MKHINKKIRLAGAMPSTLRQSRVGNGGGNSGPRLNRMGRPISADGGGGGGGKGKANTKGNSKGPEIIPPVYLPPQLGGLQYGASHSYAETIDLITDGPIEGIVNQNGLLCDGTNILQGIYLNDTPVAVTDNSTIEGYYDLGSTTDPTGILAFNDSKLISGFFQDIKGVGAVTTQAPSRGVAAPQSLISTAMHWQNKNGPRKLSEEWRGVWIRNNIGSYKLFTKDAPGASPDERSGSPFIPATDRNSAGRRPWNKLQNICLYTDNSTVQNSKFMFGLGNQRGFARWYSPQDNFKFTPRALSRTTYTDTHSDGSKAAHPCCGLQDNLDDIYENFYSQTENKHQKELARRVLGRLGSEYPEEPLGNRLETMLNASSSRNCHVVLRPDPTQAGMADINLLNGGKLMDYGFKCLNSEGVNVFKDSNSIYIYDFICPEITTEGVLTGNVKGFILISFAWSIKAAGRTTRNNNHEEGSARSYGVADDVNSALSSISSIRFSRNLMDNESVNPKNLKFNYSNVLAEFRKGTEDQLPLKYFNKVFIDHTYDTALYGPFKTNGKRAQSIATNRNMLSKNFRSNISVNEQGLPVEEGSEDTRGRGRGRYDYANWAKESLPNFEEDAIPLTHVVLNPNVESVFVTLSVGALSDTLHTQLRSVRGALGDGTLNPGATFPSILNVSVTTGLIGEDGSKTPHRTRNYRIVALIQSNTLIDIGNPDGIPDANTYVAPLGDAENLVTPIALPLLSQENLRAHQDSSLNKSVIITPDSHISVQRYVEVRRLSTETNSVMISKSVDLSKITEIIPVNLTYPFSTMVGTKLDSRSFGSIPVRSFDCKLKKVKVPSNYEPLLPNGVDKRYYLSQGKFDNALKENKLIYDGDWDGSFNDDLQWTDNPAWILYDLLTSTRYGLGQHIDEDSVNKWQLYQIGRFCDAVDENGYFLGVPDGHGGREPRFSCNIVFDAGMKIYDALNTIVGLFRGAIFFNNGEINFVDDRPRETVDLFTNDSVKDGMFHYANNRRDQTYNTIEVTYTDRFDSYIPKVEVVEDEEDVRQRGVFKKKMAAIGITSRAMARRAAQHQIFSAIKENQTVAFEAGLETLLCQPGDLVIIEDELKTLKENFGKVLEVNVQDETIRMSNRFSSADMTGRLTVYTPTGRDTIEGVDDVASRNRQRSLGFNITGGMDVLSRAGMGITFSGDYNFSGYTAGYPYATGTGQSQFEQYALYTGTGASPHRNMLYFSTAYTGWVFATGDSPFVDNSGQSIFIASGDASGSANSLYGLGTGFINNWDTSKADRRGSRDWGDVSGLFSGNNIINSITRGILPSEVMLTAPSQTTVLNTTGQIILKDYGCLVSGFNEPEMLPLLKVGSAAKFEIKDASNSIYKILGVKEVNPNEFLVSATRYETGKWELIEDNISIEHKANTFAYRVAQTINGVTYTTLDPPSWTGLTTGDGTLDKTFFISGDFTDPNGGPPIANSNATGFNVILNAHNGEQTEQNVLTASNGPSSFCVKFDNLDSIGIYSLNVCALGNQGATDTTNAYFNSSYDQTGMFVLFEENLLFGRSRAEGLNIQ